MHAVDIHAILSYMSIILYMALVILQLLLVEFNSL